MICKVCGKRIPDDAKFCQECGTPQNAATRESYGTNQSKSTNRNGKKMTIREVIAACVVVVCTFFLLCTPKSPLKFLLFLIVASSLLYLSVKRAERGTKANPQDFPVESRNSQPNPSKVQQESLKIRTEYANKSYRDPDVNTEEELREFCEVHPLLDHFSVKVKGVTFNNDDGSSRQEILSCCCAGERVGFRRFQYEGSPAFAVSTEYGEIGCLPAELASSIDYAYGPESYLCGTIGEITGGYDNLYYGCILDLCVYGPVQKED